MTDAALRLKVDPSEGVRGLEEFRRAAETVTISTAKMAQSVQRAQDQIKGFGAGLGGRGVAAFGAGIGSTSFGQGIFGATGTLERQLAVVKTRVAEVGVTAQSAQEKVSLLGSAFDRNLSPTRLLINNVKQLGATLLGPLSLVGAVTAVIGKFSELEATAKANYDRLIQNADAFKAYREQVELATKAVDELNAAKIASGGQYDATPGDLYRTFLQKQSDQASAAKVKKPFDDDANRVLYNMALVETGQSPVSASQAVAPSSAMRAKMEEIATREGSLMLMRESNAQREAENVKFRSVVDAAYAARVKAYFDGQEEYREAVESAKRSVEKQARDLGLRGEKSVNGNGPTNWVNFGNLAAANILKQQTINNAIPQVGLGIAFAGKTFDPAQAEFNAISAASALATKKANQAAAIKAAQPGITQMAGGLALGGLGATGMFPGLTPGFMDPAQYKIDATLSTMRFDAQKKAADELRESMLSAVNAIDRVGDRASDVAAAIVLDFNNTGNALRSLWQGIVQEILQAKLLDPLKEQLGEFLLGSDFFKFMFTSGAKPESGVLAQGGLVHNAAQGLTVNGPSQFQYPGGKLNVGEMGKELGFFPLETVNGKLGVAGSGGGSTTNVMINVKADDPSKFGRSMHQTLADIKRRTR